jgi:hypothetical protein
MTDRRTLFESDLTRVARERDEARRALDDLRDRVEGFDVTRDELDAALDRAEERDRYREALERITARYVGGASAGELADIAFEALRGESE